jgi:hypothetical protein
MRPRHSILLLSLVILAGCGSEEASQPGNGDFTGAHDPALESPVTVHRGLYSWGHDLNEFRPCDSTSAYWITGSRRLVERLKMKYSQVAIRPYDVVYAELEGRILQGPGDEETASEYPGRFQLTEILLVRPRVEGECVAAQGTDD